MAEVTVSSNVDPAEVAQFERLANSWWDPEGPFWPLHGLNALRTAYLTRAICKHFGRDAEATQPLDGLKVIDIGCGGGLLSESFARLGAGVRGIDVVEKNLRIAQGHARNTGLEIDYEYTTSTACVDQGETFDVVLNMEVVEHVPDPALLIQECAQLCKPGGFVCIATINRTLKAWVFAIVGAEYILRLLPKGTHQWGKFVTPLEVETELANNGCFVIDKRGVRVNPFARRFSLASSLQVNYMITASRT